jgi:CRP/FNR family cyclic AMP-dependent transcriptional regulator
MGIIRLFRDWREVEEFDPEAVIFKEGDPADELYVILAGEVALTLHGQSLGSEAKGSIIGEMALLESATRNATATARSKVKVAKLDRRQLQKMIRESPEFSLRAMTVLAGRLRAVDRYISAQLDRQRAAE